MNNKEALAEFGAYLNRIYVDRSTPQHYLSDLRIFLNVVDQKSVGQIDSRDIDHFGSEQRQAGMSAATINRRMSALHAFFEWLAGLEPESTGTNPVVWRRHGPKQSQPIARDATDSEVAALFAQIEGLRDRAIFGLMVGAGLRVGEVSKLEMSDLQSPSGASALARLIVRGKGQKERIVWLTPTWYEPLAAYQAERGESNEPRMFLNHRGQAISINGIQHRFQIYCSQAGLTLTCHRLRHTFARRLAEQRMPIESISKLLGHTQVETTQRYTAGADPSLRAEFEAAMAQLEVANEEPLTSAASQPIRPARQNHPPDMAELEKALARYASFPLWLRPVLEAHLRRHWSDWKPHMAAQHAHRTSIQLAACWHWLVDTFSLSGWDTLKRPHIEAWIASQLSRGLAAATVKSSYDHLYSLLRFAKTDEIELHPQLFRIKPPQVPDPLPRHLSDAEYQRLLQLVMTETETAEAGILHRTWFLMLAFTGIRLSELLDLRLSDLDLSTRRLFIHDAKNHEGRVCFLTPSLVQLLQGYLAWRPDTDTDHLFVSPQGLPFTPSPIRYRCRKWGELSGFRLSPHRLRHTFATRLINHDMPLASIQRLLGHRTLHMTQRYARLNDATVRRHFEDASAHIEGIAISDWPFQIEHNVLADSQHSANSM